MLAPQPRSGAHCAATPFRSLKTERANMTAAIPALTRAFSSGVGTGPREENASERKTGARSTRSSCLRPWLAAICLGASCLVLAPPAFARGPDGIADVAEKVIDAVVNISTSQTVEAKGGPSSDSRGAMPKLPPGSPFEEFFDDFFKNHRGGPGGGSGDLQPHKTTSLGSGFIVDTSGIVVTNNHVIADADEITVIMNDGSKFKGE